MMVAGFNWTVETTSSDGFELGVNLNSVHMVDWARYGYDTCSWCLMLVLDRTGWARRISSRADP